MTNENDITDERVKHTIVYVKTIYPNGCPLCLAEKMEEECRPFKERIMGRKRR